MNSVTACLLLCVVYAANAKPTEESCMVSAWGPWSRCESSKACPPTHRQASFHLPVSTIADKGREMMSIMSKDKLSFWSKIQRPASQPKSNGFRACDETGMAGKYPCRNIDQMSFLNFEDLGYVDLLEGDSGPRGNDIWGWTDPEDNEEYAIICVSGGTSFVRITNATNPEPLAFLYSRTGPSSWRDVKVVNDVAYIVSEATDHGMQVFNLLRLRGKHGLTIEKSDFDYDLVGNSHNIVENKETQFVYIVGATDKKYEASCLGGLHFVDVSEPLKPKYAGCYPDDGYTHDAECVIYRGPDKNYHGKEICFNYNEDTLTIVDVSDKNAPKLISKEGYTGSMYTHQGWLTEDQTTILMNDEQDEIYDGNKYTKTYIWDVVDLKYPILKNVYYHNQESIDHNLYIIGDLTFESNYGSGLRILHIDQANYDLQEVGFFDVYPERDEAKFEGTWSNYPFYKSGNVAVSSIEYGLFVVRPNYASMMAEVNEHKDIGRQTRERSVLAAKDDTSCPSLKEIRRCEPSQC